MQNTITLKTTTSTAATTATKVTSKMALQPGMRVALELNGVPISETQVAQTKLAVTKVGDSLVVEMPDGSAVELVDFYITDGVTLEGDMWELSGDSALTQTAQGLVAQPVQVAQTADTGVVGSEAIAANPDIAVAVGEVVAETAPASGGIGIGGVLGGLAGLGLAAAVAPVVGSLATVLKIAVFAGPITDATGLSVEAFGLDGSVLVAKAPLVLAADGTYDMTLPAGYTGAVLLRITDADSGADYRDEGTQNLVDLTVDLRALINVSDSAAPVQAITISPLSEMAVEILLGDMGGDNGSSAVVVSAAVAANLGQVNARIASAMDLSASNGGTDLARLAVQPVVDTAGNAVAGNYAGTLLAAISGYEKHTNKTTQETIAAMVASVSSPTLSTLDDLIVGSLAVSTAAFEALNIGADKFTASTVAQLDAALLNAIPVATLGGLSAAAVQAIPVTLLGSLSAVALAAITDDLSAAQTTAVAEVVAAKAVTTTAAAAITAEGVNALSPTTVGALTPDALGALTAAAVGSLDAAQVAAITPAQASGITSSQVDALSGAQIAAITPSTLGALGPAAVTSLSVEQVGAITTAQATAVTPTQIDFLTTAQIGAITPAAVAGLSAAAIGSLSAAQTAAIVRRQRV